MDLKQIVKRLEEYADLKLAESWDNVGLVVEPSEPLLVKRALVTNDLTEPVLEEAISKNVNLIISYHPAITTLKRLTQSEWKQRSIVKCIENRIAVYSPHTTWDSRDGGSNDWLLEAFETTKIETANSIRDTVNPTGYEKNLKFIAPNDSNREEFLSKVSQIDNVKLVGLKEILISDSSKSTEIDLLANARAVPELIDLIKSRFDSKTLTSLRIYDLDKPFLKNAGLGRIAHLKEPIKIRDIVDRMKSYLNMKTFRLALGKGKTLDDKISVLSVGAGCCSEVLNNVNAEFIITGEFFHHEILHEVHRGISIIVTDHSNTERGYAQIFKKRFNELLAKYNEQVELIISEEDRDPLEYI